MFNKKPEMFGENNPGEMLPNGYTRLEYLDNGFSNKDIEFWGLDQPGAPPPHAAGWEILDAMDGDYDGDIDF